MRKNKIAKEGADFDGQEHARLTKRDSQFFLFYSSTILALITPGTARSFFMISSDAI